ncbi:MAG: hypothetical protein J5887_01465 [Erysipelotrichaceae bacterium]|nr:hypothetical protein [Erysipelotrichaceae bacterium]
MLMVLLIMSILLLFSVRSLKREVHKPVSFVIDEIVMRQYEAIIECEKTYYEEYDCEIRFNRRGNVNQANTYHVYGSRIIVTLGTGRVYVKK